MSSFRGSKVIIIIKTVCIEGKGVEGDPIREVIHYSTLEGELLYSVDTWKKEKEQAH